MAGNDAGGFIETEPLRQSRGREADRPRPGAGNSIKEWVSRASAVDLRPVDSWLGPGFRCQNDLFLRRRLGGVHGLRSLARKDEFRLGPVGVVEIQAVARRARQKQQSPNAGQGHVHGPGFLTAFHDAAVEKALAVAVNPKGDAAPAIGGVIHAHFGPKSLHLAVKIHVQRGIGMCPDTALEYLSGDGEGFTRDALIHQRFAPPAGHPGDIQLPQPDDLRGQAAVRTEH